jgi:hypothetical protein
LVTAALSVAPGAAQVAGATAPLLHEGMDVRPASLPGEFNAGTDDNESGNSGSADGHGRSGQGQAPPKSAKTRTNGISYHGGPVMLPTKNAYVIFYGNWSSATAQAIITDYLSGVGGSPYFNINTTYTDGSGRPVTNSVALAGTTTDNYSQGTSFTDAQVLPIVSAAINSGRLPKDTGGVYIVAASSDVNETSGFGTQWCGWHDHGTVGGSDIKYSFTEDATRVLSACAAQTTSPNGNAGVDAQVNIIAHELEEAATDPDLNAWFDTRGAENADKCAWTFGTVSTATNGSKFNVTLGTRQYLIQRNWVNASGGFCAIKYP